MDKTGAARLVVWVVGVVVAAVVVVVFVFVVDASNYLVSVVITAAL